jgi:type I restriction enzyme S subunit
MLSEVPEGWSLQRFGEIASVKNGFAFKSKDFVDSQSGVAAVVRMSDLKKGTVEASSGKKIPLVCLEGLEKFRLEAGDFVFGMSGSLSNYAVVPASSVPLYLNQRVGKLEAKSTDAVFLRYLYTSESFMRLVEKSASGNAQLNISSKQIESFEVFVPPLNEQHRIAEILSSVDASIQATQAVIEQAERVKRGLMEELLTGGLGSEAIERGEVPEGWKETVVGDACQKVSVGIASSTTHAYTDSGVPLLRNQNIKYGFIDDTEVLEITREFDEQNASKRLRAGDVISMRTGYTGASALVDERFDGCQSFTTLISRPKSELLCSMYLVHWMNSPLGRRLVKSLEVGGAQANLNAGTLKKFPLLLPSLTVQEEIVERIDSITKIVVVNERTLAQQALTKKGLMDDLLTGKVRTV